MKRYKHAYQRYIYNDLDKDCERYGISERKKEEMKSHYHVSRVLSAAFTVSFCG